MKFRFRFRFSYLFKVFKTCFCLHKRKLCAIVVLDIPLSISFHLGSFPRITHRFKSKDTDVSYLICKCEFLDCHVTYTLTHNTLFFFMNKRHSKAQTMSLRVFVLENNVKTNEREMINAVASKNGDCIECQVIS